MNVRTTKWHGNHFEEYELNGYGPENEDFTCVHCPIKENKMNTNTSPEETIEVNYSQWLSNKQDYRVIWSIAMFMVVYSLVMTPIAWYFRGEQVRLQKLVDSKTVIFHTVSVPPSINYGAALKAKWLIRAINDTQVRLSDTTVYCEELGKLPPREVEWGRTHQGNSDL